MLFVQVIKLQDHPSSNYHFLKVQMDHYIYSILNPEFPIREICSNEIGFSENINFFKVPGTFLECRFFR